MRQKNLLFITTLIILLPTAIFSQYNPSISHTMSNGLATYNIQNAGTNTFIFTLFGDGEFSIEKQPKHQFATGTYTTEAYFARPYKPTLPPKKTRKVVNKGNTNTNGTSLPMTTNIALKTSWSPAYDNKHFFIIAFKNTSSSTVDGCIEFLYNTAQLKINNNEIKDYGKVKNLSVSNINVNGFNKELEWKFDSLKAGETRYIYVFSKVKIKPGKKLNVSANYKVNCSNSSSSTSSATGNFLVRRYPHDPNFKIVDKNCIKPAVPAQKLEYTIGFFNDGTGPAEDVYLYDELPDWLNYSTVMILDFEHEPITSINDNKLTIDFLDIYLPGIAQISPKPHTYEDAASYVTFSICTEPYLPPNLCLENMADITFYGQPTFTTNPAVVCTKEVCDPEYCNSFWQPMVVIDDETDILDTEVALALQAYPNPAKDNLTVEIDFNSESNTDFILEILDYSGKKVKHLFNMTENIAFFEEQFYIGDLPNGIYMLVLKTEKTVSVQKIIKQ